MGFDEIILNVFANLDLALIDLFILELLIMILFHIDKSGNVKVTIDWLFGISRSRKTELFVFPFIILGSTYFFVSNYFQDKIMQLFIEFFGYSLIVLFFALLCFVIFFVSYVIVGRVWKFRMCRPYFWISIILFTIVGIWMFIGKALLE